MEGIRDGISFLSTLDFVDKERLFGPGICASGGYMAMAIVATTDKRLKAIATVSGMLNNTGSYFGMMTREQIVPILEMANQARQREYETGETEYFDTMGFEGLNLSELLEGSAQAEGYDFYMTPHAGCQTYPNYTHKTVSNLMQDAPLTSATALAPYLYTPYLDIYGSRAMQDTGSLTVAFYEAASEPKELYEIEGASHVSLYDIDEDVDRAVTWMDEFFGKYAS